MKLFLTIYNCLLASIVVLLAIEGNISYETAIKQFDGDMADQAEQIGIIVAGMAAETWREQGQSKALALISGASQVNRRISFRWLSADEFLLNAQSGTIQSGLRTDGGIVSQKTVMPDGAEVRLTYVPVAVDNHQVGGVELTQSLTPLVDYSRMLLIRSLLIMGLLAMISGVIIYVFISFKIRRPLERLTAKAVRIGKGDISADLMVKGNDELADLARTMNDMCTRLLIAQGKIYFEHDARIKTLEQLRHSEKLSTIGQIAAGIAHEIGTPLNVVDGRAKMIIRENLDQAEAVECARIINNQVEKISYIIRQLLDFSRRGKARKEILAVEPLVRQVLGLLKPLASCQKIDLVFSIAPGTKQMVYADTSQIQQILMNVIMNGLQAMVNGGRIMVSLESKDIIPHNRVEDRKGSFVRIAVADEGPGIADEHRDRLFEPFFTTKQRGVGTGLGLSIAKELAEEHGGWIEVHNGQDSGACFFIYLPISREECA